MNPHLSKKERLSPASTLSTTRWDELRYILETHHLAASFPHEAKVFHPGDISACHASISITALEYMSSLGYGWGSFIQRHPRGSEKHPKRYCVVNRHIEGSIYEVYLLTTFGGSTKKQTIPIIGRYFGMPMGATTPIYRHVPAIVTVPPMPTPPDGKSSFLLAIPTKARLVEQTSKYHVPQSELRRISEYIQVRKQQLPMHHMKLLESVRKKNWDEEDWTDDVTYPLKVQNMPVKVLDGGPFVKRYAPKAKSPALTLESLNLGQRFSAVIQEAHQHLLDASSNYLTDTTITRPRHIGLPPPYYAPCLRLSFNRIMQIIR